MNWDLSMKYHRQQHSNSMQPEKRLIEQSFKSNDLPYVDVVVAVVRFVLLLMDR